MSASRLLRRITDEIRTKGPMSFARFMDLALHDPEDGYYARGPERLGPTGDFITASDAGSAFGECLARQLQEMDRSLGHPSPFTVIEFGAGRGLLARDVLDALLAENPSLARRLRYLLVDRSPGMRRLAAHRVPEAEVLTPQSLTGSHVGCIVAVEVFDALPVHRVRRRGRALREILVDLDDGGRLVESVGDPSEDIMRIASRYGAAREEGDEAEIALPSITLLDAMSEAMARGFILVVDYGYRAAELHGPAHRRGTLLAYHRHRWNERYLERVGEQDLTAHVNLSLLEDRAVELGFRTLGQTSQERFLIANGILERFREEAGGNRHDPDRVRSRLQALQLIHPEGMGRAFQVLGFSRGVDPAPRLAGFEDPLRRAMLR